MKSYAIYDEDLDRTSAIGYLFYYEKSESFVIELCEDLDEWEAPLLFQKLIREKRYTISSENSLMWVKERVIPSGRQNIGSILKKYKLKEYSEIAMLELSNGRCSQDNCYISELREEEIPTDIVERMRKNIWEVFPTEENQLICLFADDVVKKVDISLLLEKYRDIPYLIKNSALLDSVKIGAGGYNIIFNDSIEIQTSDLREVGLTLPLCAKDFYTFVRRNVVDTTKACDMLQCSRQNLSYMAKTGKIQPVIYGTKENLYLKGVVERVSSD